MIGGRFWVFKLIFSCLYSKCYYPLNHFPSQRAQYILEPLHTRTHLLGCSANRSACLFDQLHLLSLMVLSKTHVRLYTQQKKLPMSIP